MRKESTSKYVRLCGMTLKQLAAKYGGHFTAWAKLYARLGEKAFVAELKRLKKSK
jgi:hypothetical protein